MKRLTTATILSAFAALALGAGGCKGGSAKKPPPAAEETANGGPLLLPHGPGLGAPGGGGGDVARAARRDRDPAAIGGMRGPRPGWANQTPEEMLARREEMQARRDQRRQEMLDTYDADHDGRLSEDERAAMQLSRVTQMVDRLDADKDGKVSKAEMADVTSRNGRPMPDFDRLDLDRDGFVTADEMGKMMPRPGPRGGRFFGGEDEGGPDAPPTTTVPAPAPTEK